MTSQPGKQTFGIHIETPETFFLKNHTQNVVKKTIARPFPKNSKLSISLDQ